MYKFLIWLSLAAGVMWVAVCIDLRVRKQPPIDPPIGMGIAYNGKEWKFVHTGGANSFNTYASRAEAVAAAWSFKKVDDEHDAQPPFTNLYAAPKPVETVTVHVSTNTLDYTAYRFGVLDQRLEYYNNNQLSLLRSFSNCLETLNAFEERIKELERERRRSCWNDSITITTNSLPLLIPMQTNFYFPGYITNHDGFILDATQWNNR